MKLDAKTLARFAGSASARTHARNLERKPMVKAPNAGMRPCQATPSVATCSPNGSGEQAIIAHNLAAVESHFHAEDGGSVSRALEAFTDDCVWEAPNPIGLDKRLVGKKAIRPFYERLFTTMKDVTFHICYERFATADRVVDDSVCTFEVAADGVWPYPVGTLVFMRIVHVFDMRDGKIAKEKVFEMRRPARSKDELMQMVEQAKVGSWRPA